MEPMAAKPPRGPQKSTAPVWDPRFTRPRKPPCNYGEKPNMTVDVEPPPSFEQSGVLEYLFQMAIQNESCGTSLWLAAARVDD